MAPKIGMSSAAIFLLVVIGISENVRALMDPPPPELDVDCDLHLTEGVAVTVQEACGDQFRAYYTGAIVVGQAFTVEAVVGGEVRATRDFTTIDLSGDFTSHVGQMSVTVGDPAAPACNNEFMKAELILKTGSEAFSSGNTTVTIMCDFRGVDLDLQQTGSQVSGAVVVDNGQTIGSALQLAGTNLQFSVVRTDGGTSLPSLAGGTCYFVAVYLSKKAPDGPCNEDDYMSQPDIRYGDYVVGLPICFKTFAELSTINSQIQQILQTDLSNTGLCGDFSLMISVDPMHTIFGEASRCNNFYSFPVQFTCSPMGPQCEIVRNPWDPQEGASFVFHGDGEKADIFRYQQWMGFSERIEDNHNLQRATDTGYGRLKLLKIYVGSLIQSSAITCPTDAQDAVTRMEASDDIPDGADESFLVHTESALAHIESLAQASTGGYETIKAAIQNDIDALTPPAEGSTLADKVTFRLKMGALNTAKEIADMYSRGDDMFSMFLQGSLCHVAHWVKSLEYERHALREKTDAMEIKHVHMNLLDIAGNVSKTFVAVKKFAPQFACFQKVFLGVAKFVSDIEMPTVDSDFLFDMDFEMDGSKDEVNFQKSGCNRFSRCLKKAESMCEVMSAQPSCEAVINDDAEVCLMKSMQDFAMTHYRTLGLFDLQKVFLDRNDEPGNTCPDMEPLKPKKGPLVFWKHDETTGRIKRGIPNLVGDEICWKEVATCTCQQCDAMSSSTTTTTPQMPLK